MDGVGRFSTTAISPAGSHRDERSAVHLIVVEETLERFPPSDHHLPRDAYAALAQSLCMEIAAGATGRCVPPSWEPNVARMHHVLNVGG